MDYMDEDERSPPPPQIAITSCEKLGITYCKVDICGAAEATSSEKELTDLTQFLHEFADAEHLYLEFARLGAGADEDAHLSFPTFPNLRHLELWGSLPDDGALTAVTTILERAPSLDQISLVFHPHGDEILLDRKHLYTQDELDDMHHLKYNPYAMLAVPAGAMISGKLREINLVHYQGSLPQRTLAKLLLCNAPAIAELCCVLAEGPFWMQIKLKQEIQDWVMNESAKIIFY